MAATIHADTAWVDRLDSTEHQRAFALTGTD
jgi:hypothetical protein